METLKEIRKARGLSQRQLAARAGINHATVVMIETGKNSPNVATLEKLADALGVEMADLFPKVQPELWASAAPPRLRVARPATPEEQADLEWSEGASEAELKAAYDAALDALEESGEPSMRRVESPDAPLSEAERERIAARRELERRVILYSRELRKRERLEERAHLEQGPQQR